MWLTLKRGTVENTPYTKTRNGGKCPHTLKRGMAENIPYTKTRNEEGKKECRKTKTERDRLKRVILSKEIRVNHRTIAVKETGDRKRM